MNKKFIILANSRKLGGRCLAGIVVVERVAGNFIIDLEGGGPKWIRPISKGQNGEISLETAEKFQNLEIVELVGVRHSPEGFQSENVQIDQMQFVQKTHLLESELDLLCDHRHDDLFGNKGRAIKAEMINDLNYSLMMIKPSKFSVYETQNARGGKQVRGKFHFKQNEYDLPITDANYQYRSENGKIVYLALSVGLEFEGWHSKLIAGVHLA